MYLLTFSAIGALWGWWRPHVVVTKGADGQWFVDTARTIDNVEFVNFASYVLISGCLAGILAAIILYRLKSCQSLSMMLWVGLSSTAGACALWVVGNQLSLVVSHHGDSMIDMAPQFFPGVGILFAPWVALFVYWAGLYLRMNVGNPAPPVSDSETLE